MKKNMEDLEKEFEEMLVNTKNAELIAKYAELKEQINQTLELSLQTINRCLSK